MILFVEQADGSINTEHMENLLSLNEKDLLVDDSTDVKYKKYLINQNFMGITDDYYPNEIRRTQFINREEIINLNREIIKIYLKTKITEGKSLGTILQYKIALEYFFFQIIKPITDITALDIRNYLLDYKNARDITNNSLDNVRRNLNAFFKFLEEEDFIMKSPMRKIKKIKGEKIVKHPFSEEEIEILRDSCLDIRELAIVDFLNSSGVRLSECCALDRTDIDLEKREGLVVGKGNKQRIIYFSACCKVHLEKYLNSRFDNNPALFVTANSPHMRISKRGLEFLISSLGKRAGVQGCHPHRFRRTMATRLLYKGVPIEQVQRLLGHTKIETTLIYAEVNQEEVKANHQKHI